MLGAVTPCSRNFPAWVINVINGCAPKHNGSSSSSFSSSSEPVNPQSGCRLSGEQVTCLPRQCQCAYCWITMKGPQGTLPLSVLVQQICHQAFACALCQEHEGHDSCLCAWDPSDSSMRDLADVRWNSQHWNWKPWWMRRPLYLLRWL